MKSEKSDPKGTVRISPDQTCIAVRGECDGELIWYMIEIGEYQEGFGVDETWPIIWGPA